MHDLATRIRDHYESAADPVTVDEIFAAAGLETTLQQAHMRPTPAPADSRRRLVAVAAATAVLILVGGTALIFRQTGTDSPVAPVATSPPVGSVSSLSWSRVPHDADVFGEARMHSVVAGGPGLVAVGWTGTEVSEGHVDGDAAVWTSVDGTTWESVPDHGDVFTDGEMASVIVGGPGFVAVGGVERDDSSMAAIWTSPDGITWSLVPHDEAVFGDAWMADVTVGGPGLVAIGEGESDPTVEWGPTVWTSVDGITWTRVPQDPARIGGRMRAVTAGGPGLVAVGIDWPDELPSARAAIWTSVDGIAWNRVPHDENVFGGFGHQRADSVAVVGTRVVAVGVDRKARANIDAAVWTSEDGIVWQRVAHDEAALGEGEMWNVTVGGPGFVSVGFIGPALTSNSDAAVWTSIDGVIWNRVPHDEDLFGGVEMWSVAAGGPGLVAVGSDGPDAAVWTSQLDDGRPTYSRRDR